MLALAALQLFQHNPVGLAITGRSDIKGRQLLEFIFGVSDHRLESRICRREMLRFAENRDAHERICNYGLPPCLVRPQLIF
jgi:hypothetical protein